MSKGILSHILHTCINLTCFIVVSPKALKRSISTDISEITSIVIKGLTKEYFNKELLTEYLSVYGKIKVVLQPARGNAVITFNSHVSTNCIILQHFKIHSQCSAFYNFP